MNNTLTKINKMLDGSSTDIFDVFAECYKLHDYATGDRPVNTLGCGSAAVTDTPKTLYRLLCPLRPASVSFSDMYKSSGMLEICSPDYHFCASVQLFKYQLGVYFHCVAEHRHGDGRGVFGGWPGADNGERCTSKIGRLWYKTLMRCIETELDIYSGNDFVV